MLKLISLPLILFSLVFQPVPPTTDEIDAYWAEVSRTVTEGDFEGYAALYHEDAALVNGISGTSYPISDALAGWKQGFDDTSAGKMKASVEFRFTERIHGEAVAHDTGIFNYTSQMGGEAPQPIYVHFQGLMVKKDGEWKMTMEYQIATASEADWNKIE